MFKNQFFLKLCVMELVFELCTLLLVSVILISFKITGVQEIAKFLQYFFYVREAMLDLKLKGKIPCLEIRKRTKIIDIIEYTLKQKWKWAGHIARLKDNRWTRRCTEWQPRRGKRSRGRPSRRWQDDITEKEGTTWIRKATDRRRWKTLMEGYILQWMDKA